MLRLYMDWLVMLFSLSFSLCFISPYHVLFCYYYYYSLGMHMSDLFRLILLSIRGPLV